MNKQEIILSIKKEAEKKELTRYQIAKTIGVADSQIKRWLENTSEPSLSNLIALCNAVGLEIKLKKAPLKNL